MGYKNGIPYVTGSDTSRAAAESIEPDLGRLLHLVLTQIRACGSNGATDDELEVTLGLPHQTVSARRRDLVLRDYVVDSGYRRTTRSGRGATVWVAR